MNIAAARTAPLGETIVIRATVLAEGGRLGTPPLFAVGDASGGLPVRLADGQVAPARGTLVEARGTLAAPYGQLELRLAGDGLVATGPGPVPSPMALTTGAVGEDVEGRLARVAGTISAGPTKATSGDLAFTVTGADGSPLRILADASADLDTTSLRRGASVTLTGIIGQRASRKGALDGYRLWLRDQGDVHVTSSPSASPGTTTSPTSSTPSTTLLSIAAARLREGRRVTVEGTVTVDRTLLDASGRRTILEDASGAIELYLEGAETSIRTGVRLRATGTVGRAWGAPRLRVDAFKVVGRRDPVVRDLRGLPATSSEWRLVRVRGTLAEVHRSGDRWTAELVDGERRVPLVGLAGSGLAAASLVEGRQATVVGIVKRPYPTARDQRFAVAPRSSRDLVLGTGPDSSSRPDPSGSPGPSPAAGSATGASTSATTGGDVPLVDLGGHLGETVRVGGVVSAVEAEGVRLDDGTATARIILEAEAAGLAGLLQAGDAINASGVPEARDEVVLVVRDPAGIVIAGDLGGQAGEPSDDAALTVAAILGDEPGAGGRDAHAAQASLTGGSAPATLGLATVLLTGVLGAGLGAHRVRASKRRERARILARLEAVAGPPPAVAGAPETP